MNKHGFSLFWGCQNCDNMLKEISLWKGKFVLVRSFFDLSQLPALVRDQGWGNTPCQDCNGRKSWQATGDRSGEGPTIAFKVPLLRANFLPLGLLKVCYVSIAPQRGLTLRHTGFWEHSRLKLKQKLLKQNGRLGQTWAQNSTVTTKTSSSLFCFP